MVVYDLVIQSKGVHAHLNPMMIIKSSGHEVGTLHVASLSAHEEVNQLNFILM